MAREGLFSCVRYREWLGVGMGTGSDPVVESVRGGSGRGDGPSSSSFVAHNGPVERIVWFDVETTGLDPECDLALEVGARVTDMRGVRVLDRDYQALIDVGDLGSVMDRADERVQRLHSESGLWADLWSAGSGAKPVGLVDVELTAWLEGAVDGDRGTVFYFGGNSVAFDRAVARVDFPMFSQHFSHRLIDATCLSLFVKAVGGPKFHKVGTAHRALADALSSLEEYRHYVAWAESSLST